MSNIPLTQVTWGKRVQKELENLPSSIVTKFEHWVFSVETVGIKKVRTQPGYHDEPLKGDRKGQRSVRLNKAYRAIYIEKHDGTIEFIEVIKVSKHEY